MASFAVVIFVFIGVEAPGALYGFFFAVIVEMMEALLAPSSLGDVFGPAFWTDFFRHVL